MAPKYNLSSRHLVFSSRYPGFLLCTLVSPLGTLFSSLSTLFPLGIRFFLLGTLFCLFCTPGISFSLLKMKNGVPRREKIGCREEKKGMLRREKGGARMSKRGLLEDKLYLGATVPLY